MVTGGTARPATSDTQEESRMKKALTIVMASIAHARVLLERFRVEYNTEHLHSSLGYLTPAEYGAACSAGAA